MARWVRAETLHTCINQEKMQVWSVAGNPSAQGESTAAPLTYMQLENRKKKEAPRRGKPAGEGKFLENIIDDILLKFLHF